MSDEALLRRMLEQMWLIRAFEERVMELYFQKQLTGLIHVSIGQEGVAVGVAAALRADDLMYGTHRSHGHFLAKGSDPNRMIAELAGRATGYCGGKGGSMHLVDVEHGVLGATGVVGGTVPLALGTALACKQRGGDQVVVVYFGDGAANTGGFHESLNIAALWKLPVILVCENNGYAEFTPMSSHTVVERVSVHAQAYGMPTQVLDGNDVLAVYQATQQAVARARGGGPSMIECLTYRLRGHYVGDPQAYRKADEIAEWREKDPIRRLTRTLADRGVLAEADAQGAEEQARVRVEEAVRYALESPTPTAEALTTDVYALSELSDSPTHRSPRRGRTHASERHDIVTEMRYVDAMRLAIQEEMRRDPEVFVLGEDVAVGGPFGATAGLVEEFGEPRVINTPISEDTVMGIAVGAALVGRRPVVEIMFIDFITLAMNQLVAHGAKMRYMSGGQLGVPMVVRVQEGALGGWGSHHSQCLEAWFLHVPGLKVVAPSNSADARALMKAAIRDPDPVIFLEHRALYYRSGEVPDDGDDTVTMGSARVVRDGRDVTVVAYSRMVIEALEAAAALEQRGISAEVVDLRSLAPLDMGTVGASVSKTHRLVVVQEAVNNAGVSAEITARVQEELFDELDAPIQRVGAPFAPVPAGPELEAAFVPNRGHIIAAVERTLGLKAE